MLAGGIGVALTAVVWSGAVSGQSRTAGSGGQNGGGTSSTAWQVSTCTFTVTYTWSGFHGRGLIASFGLYERKGTWDASFNLHNVEGQDGKGGTLSHTFTLEANKVAGRAILARGALQDGRTYKQVDGSSSGTSSLTSTCG
jgi:hypothetical protein